jgi:asparagine synthase (glutamine-hydrolysing)
VHTACRNGGARAIAVSITERRNALIHQANRSLVCGIAGIILKANSDRIDLAPRLRAMAQMMRHRGPDDEGIYISPDGRIGLANRRLAIRDLSPAGHMPMLNTAEDIVITYNGEIYNADDLRAELTALGHRFRSTSDTEVILRGYEQWDEAIVPRLRGMFAFAIADQRTRHAVPRLLLARDHLGIKPVYVWQSSAALVFASELKALMASGLIERAVDPAGLVGYLLTGSVPNPLTIYRDVRALEPSTYLTIQTDSLAVTSTTYWSLPTESEPIMRLDEAVERCRALLAESVRIRLVSDVPLGAFLSGGLDSSAVVGLMRQATDGPIRTCSMIFDEAEFSEAPFARAVAQQVGAEHFERVITYADVEREFDRMLYALDQPSVDGVNTYFVAQTARQAGLTVALSGIGGDELFGGYPNTFVEVPRIYRALAAVSHIPAGAAAAKFGIHLLPDRARWGRIHDALDRPASLASAYLTRRGLFAPQEVRALVSDDLWQEASQRFDPVAAVAARADANGRAGDNVFAWVSRAELRTYTHHQLLRDTDAMSMIHSLEVREPLLDRVLVEAVLRLPASVKQIDGASPKPLLARAVRDLLPESVLNRRDKQGFTFPFATWLRGGLAGRARQAIRAASDRGLIRAEAADRIYNQFQRGQIHWSRVWALVALAAAAT